MSVSINCCFARVKVRELATKHGEAYKKLTMANVESMHTDFQKHFKDCAEKFNISLETAKKRFPEINKMFLRQWATKSARIAYESTFASKVWEQLPTEAKNCHSLKSCKACKAENGSLASEFPARDKTAKSERKAAKENVTIDLKCATPNQAGKQILEKVGPLVEKKFGISVQTLLANTPTSNLEIKKTSAEKRKETRKAIREYKKEVETHFSKTGEEFIMQNRVSWTLFDKMRKECLDTSNRKRSHGESTITKTPPKRRKHGTSIHSESIDLPALLEEASHWTEDEKVNWSELARRYGIDKPNGGQIIKEILAEKGHPAAMRMERPNRAKRRSKCTTKSNITFPMYAPVCHHKKVLDQKIADGTLLIGNDIAETTECLEEEVVTIYGKHNQLLKLREHILHKHEALGIVRNNSDLFYEEMPQEQVQSRLKALGIGTKQPEDA